MEKTKLMAISVLKEYGVMEISASNVKYDNDKVYGKIFYEIWSGEYESYGKGKPKNVPIYRGFLEGERTIPWKHEEEVGTHKDIYEEFTALVDLGHPERKNMIQIGEFEKVVGNPIEIANIIKSLIDKWGSDDNFDINEIMPVTAPSQFQLVEK